MKIVLYGGGGFIGHHLAAALSTRGHQLTILTRDRESVKHLILLPNTDVIAYNPMTIASLLSPLADTDAVVNLVGILNERERGDFERTHCEFVRVLVNGCHKNKVRRFVQMSALNAAPAAPSAYLRSKAKAEQIITESSMRWTVLRPSVVFGKGDHFINLFIRLARLAPIMFLPCADAQMQPVAVEDVVRLIICVLEDDEGSGKKLFIGGPEVLSLADIVRRTLAAAQCSRPIIELGPSFSHMAAVVVEAIPGLHFLSRDNCLSAKLPSVCTSNNDGEKLLGNLLSLSSGLAAMFSDGNGPPYGGFGGLGRLSELREHSRR